jgi:GlpG protein
MRQIATLPDADQAHRLADYLLTLNINTRLEEEPQGWAVWVCDEDRVPQAREELEAFSRAPNDPRYLQAEATAATLRRREERIEKQYRRKQVNLSKKMEGAAENRRPWTFALIAGCFLVALLTGLGDTSAKAMQYLLTSSFQIQGDRISWMGLEEVAHGQLWRLVTPMFVHFGPFHLIFNVLVLYDFGSQIEARRRGWRLWLLVLLIAVSSNLAQYYWGKMHWVSGVGLAFQPSPIFGGMSGVNYGLLGYTWMKSRFEPDSGIVVHPNTVAFLLAWFFLCMTGLVGPIANVAHVVGLLVGLAIGYAPTLWRSLRGG